MDELLSWLISNKEWLFSGGGVGIVLWVGRIIFRKTHGSTVQNIRSGNGSNNFQAGQDVYFRTDKKGIDVE